MFPSYRILPASIAVGLSVFAAVSFAGVTNGLAAQSAAISHSGKALMPVVLSGKATPEVRKLADELSSALKRITGGEFAIEDGDASSKGIVIGTDEEFPGILPAAKAGLSPVLTREDYQIRTEEGRVLIIGRTPLAVQNAVWDLLYRIGYRQFFPGSNWEIWPENASLTAEIDAYESPSYYTRRIFLGGNTWKESREAFNRWEIRNRMVSGFDLKTGHSYGGVTRRNAAFFKEHPGAIAHHGPKDAQKFDPTYPGLLDLVKEDSIKQFEKDPTIDCISLDPSDGSDWRMDSPLGSPSNQAVLIANTAAQAIQEKFPGRKVGMYAYNQHSPPPEITVDPNVIVSVATAFLRGGYGTNELLKLWHEKGAEVGIREYLSVFTWERDMPGRSRASRLDYVFQSIPEFYNLGARYWVTEASNGWGAHGLGYYLSARLLWNVKEASQKDELLNDFFAKSFGAAEPEMRAYFKYILAEGRPLVSDDLIGRMYRTLDSALTKSDSPAVTSRILDFAIYTRAVELMFAYQNANGKARQGAYEELAKFVYRTRQSDIVNSLAIFKGMARRDQGIEAVNHQDPNHPLKVIDPVSEDDLREIIREGIASKQINDFDAVSFSEKLVPAIAAKGEAPSTAAFNIRGTNSLYVFFEPGVNEVEFSVKPGLIYADRGPVKLKLYSELHPIQGEAIAEGSAPPDKEFHTVKLKSEYPGLHRLEVVDGGDATEITWPAGQRVVFPASPEQKIKFGGMAHDFSFYVPAGTKVIGGFSGAGNGLVERPDGTRAHDFSLKKEPGFFSIPVKEGQEGWWRLVKVKGEKLLLTVPPYLSRSPAEALIPTEVSNQ